MCRSADVDEMSSKMNQTTGTDAIGAPPTLWKSWRSPVHAKNFEGDRVELDPLNKQLLSDRQAPESPRKQIYGVGRNYNRELGISAYRTGASIKLDCNLATGLDIIKRNIEWASSEPQSTLRLMVQGNEYWFSDASAAELFDMIVMVGDASTVRAERLNTCYEEAVPVGVCVVEELPAAEGETNTGGCCQATWLFRHDVIDGWRALRYLCRLVLGEADLTLDRLYQRAADNTKKHNFFAKACQSLATCITPVCFAPMALRRLHQIASVDTAGVRRKFYCHAICNLARLKEIGQQRELGSLTNVLTATITDAFFAADPSRSYANIASNVLFDATAPDGNHMCIKVACIPREGNTMQKTVKALQAPSQKVADLWIASVSRRYVLGHLPPPVEDFMDTRQKGLDILISSLPAYDTTTPVVLDLKVSREFTEWSPSIVYALGIGPYLFLDFYFEVRDTFEDEAFCSRIGELLEASEVHTRLPTAY